MRRRRERDITIPRGGDAMQSRGDARAGKESVKPVSPADAAPVMPQIPSAQVPDHIEDTASSVMPIETHTASKHRAAKAIGIIIGIIVALGVIGGAAAYITYQMGFWGDVEVPDVMGLNESQATKRLADAGFLAESHEEKVDEGYGTVTSMEPKAGQAARHDSVVMIGIGQQRIMPDVIGLKPDEAKNMLVAEGSKVEPTIEYRVSVDQDEDTILESYPEAGTTIKSTDEITLYVARSLKVPDVTGMQQEEACAAIEELGLATQVEWRESSELYPTVLETSPLPGTRVEDGSTVTVYVANGGPEDMWHLIGYHESSSWTDAEYLDWQQWSFQYSDSYEGYINTELWSNGNYDLFFGADPWTFGMYGSWEYEPSESALYYDAAFDSVRMNFTDLSDGTADEKTVQRYMELCGFDNPQDTCTDADIALPDKKTFDSAGVSRVCTYGVTDGCTWVILLKSANDGAVETSICVMNDAAVARLTAAGGSVCDMFMFRDAYPNGLEDDAGSYDSEEAEEEGLEA